MSPIIEALTGSSGGVGIAGGVGLSFLVDVSFKGALVLLLALLLTATLRRHSASVRHHVWTLAFGAVMALPALAGILPDWRVPVPGFRVVEIGRLVRSGDFEPAPGPVRARSAAGETRGGAVASAARDMPPVTPPAAADREVAGPGPGAAPSALSSPTAAGISVGRLLMLVWLTGTLLLLGRLSIGVASAWWVSRTATPLDDPSWRAMVRALAGELGLSGDVRVLRSGRVGTPMAWGLVRPTLLLPVDVDGWSTARRRAVLLHELAHLKRRDCLIQVVAQATRALHWFNPLAWIGIGRLQAERERACDDLVLVSGTRSGDYARLLLDVARARAADRRLDWATVSMARPSQLEGRLLAILDPHRNRRGLGQLGSGMGLLAAALVVPLAAFSAAPVDDVVRSRAFETRRAEQTSVETVVAGRRALAPDGPVNRVEGESSGMQAPADTIDRRAMEAMVRALGDDDAGIRKQAAHTLGMWESRAAVEPLSVSVREDPDVEVRAESAWALGMIEAASAVPALAAAVTDAEVRVREQAAWALGMIESADAVPALALAVDDADASVRGKTAWALGMIESADGVEPLTRALRDESPDVREQAAWALGMIEDPGGVEALVAVLRSDPNADVREQAAWALGMIEDGRAAEALIDALEDEDASVQKQAMWALGRVLDDM